MTMMSNNNKRNMKSNKGDAISLPARDVGGICALQLVTLVKGKEGGLKRLPVQGEGLRFVVCRN